MLRWLWAKRDGSAQATELYQSALAWSRDPNLYTELAVADTVDGRVEMLLLHLSILLDRLGHAGDDGRRLALAVTEAFVEHMDDTFRHIGIGDLAVPRKVKKAAAALYGAHGDYAPALASGDDAPSAWRHALHLHLISRGAAPAADVAGLATHAMALRERLAKLPDGDVLAGRLL